MPTINPTMTGTNENLPYDVDISIEGIISDQIDAATITPLAKPNRIFSTMSFSSFFIKKTIAAPRVVPKKGIIKPRHKNTASFISCFSFDYCIL